MNFLKSSKSFLKKNSYFDKIITSNILLVKFNISPFSSLDEKQNQILQNEKFNFNDKTRYSDKMPEDREKIDINYSKNDIGSYIDYIKKNRYQEHLDNRSKRMKMKLIRKILLYIR